MFSIFQKFLIVSFGCVISYSTMAQQVSGTLVDSSNNDPIAHGLVTLHGGSVQVFTDTNGNYSIDISGSGLLIVGGAKG